jgi:hypothetical protein
MTRLLLLLIAANAYAQTATLRGQITDETGAIIPNAKVTLTSKSTTSDNTCAYTSPPPRLHHTSHRSRLAAQPIKIALHRCPNLNFVLKIASRVDQSPPNDNPTPTLSLTPANNASALVLRGEICWPSPTTPTTSPPICELAGPAGPNGGAIFVDGFSGGCLEKSIREIRINQNPGSPEHTQPGSSAESELFTKPRRQIWHRSAELRQPVLNCAIHIPGESLLPAE